MPYQANKPLANDQLSQSQQDIQGNFLVLGSIGGNGNANSAGINTAPGAGFNYLFLPANANNPPLGTVFGANIGVYGFVNPSSTRSTLYISQTTQAGVKLIPSTASILGTATPGTNSDGWTFLPSGILVKWGFQSGAAWGIGNNPVNFPAGGIPAFTAAPFGLQVTIAKATTSVVDVNARIAANTVSNLAFNVDVRQANGPNPIQFPTLRIFWIAYGLGV